MAESSTMSSWSRIREGANDVERLIGQKQYNLAMIKARQTLEYMVACLTEKFGLEKSNDLSEAIDKLYRCGAISTSSADHYHRIRQIGNRAAHEGDDKPSSANEAYHLLSQELYTFANDFSSKKARRHNNSKPSGSSQPRSSGGRKTKISAELIFKIVIAILVLVIIFAIIKLIGAKKPKEVEPETEMQITVAETVMSVIETMPETEPETTASENPQLIITGDGVRVRSTPSTEDDSNILGKLAKDTVVECLGISDDPGWVKILYNDTEAYVSSDFVSQIESESDGE